MNCAFNKKTKGCLGVGRIYLAGTVPGYAQGGVVVDGVGYFVAGSRPLGCLDEYPHVAAFDVKTLKIIRAYNFGPLGDSAPLVVQKKNGDWIVIGHESKRGRSVAFNRDSGRLDWATPSNQPGGAFFGFSYFVCGNGVKYVLARADDGLHAISAETGQEVWHVRRKGGMTPAVDQDAGTVYYQSMGYLDKIEAATGRLIKTVPVSAGKTASTEPANCVSGNTLLVKDGYGHAVATYWNSKRLCSSTVKVFDRDLKMIWQTDWRLMSKKATLCYHAGRLFTGFGDSWSVRDYQRMPDNAWKKICAYDIASGQIAWECDLSAYPVLDVQGVIQCHGVLIAQTTWLGPYHVFLIDALTGRLLDVYNQLGRWASSCAQPLFTNGRLFNGDYNSNSVLAIQIGRGMKTDWPGPFGDPQLNHMSAPDQALLGRPAKPDRRDVQPSGSYRKYFLAGKARYRKKQYAEARADLMAALASAGRQGAHARFLREGELMVGHAFFYEKKYMDARGVYARILEMEEASPRIRGIAQLYLAHACRLSGDLPSAKIEYEKIATMPGILPKWLWAESEAGHCYWRAHEDDKARKAYIKAFRQIRAVPVSIRREAKKMLQRMACEGRL